MCLLLTVSAISLEVHHDKHDYLFGKKKDNDTTLLLNAKAHAHADLFTRHILKQVFRVPPPKPKPGKPTPPTPVISQVQVEDQGSGCHSVKIIGGGPGSTFVTLKFKSHRHASINYLVTLYGHPPNKHGKDDDSDSDSDQ